jgi:hypothetical protein
VDQTSDHIDTDPKVTNLRSTGVSSSVGKYRRLEAGMDSGFSETSVHTWKPNVVKSHKTLIWIFQDMRISQRIILIGQIWLRIIFLLTVFVVLPRKISLNLKTLMQILNIPKYTDYINIKITAHRICFKLYFAKWKGHVHFEKPELVL